MKIFPITLWHGTSAHLLPMIKEHGLGGRNAMEDWRVMEFITLSLSLIGAAQDRFTVEDDIELMPIRAAARGGAEGMNFEYGDVYVAGSYEKAADYALSAPEQISFTKTLVEVANRHGILTVKDLLADFPNVAAFLKFDRKPVVLKLPPLRSEMVQLEGGGAVPDYLCESNTSKDIVLRQFGFRLASPIPFEGIEVFDAVGHKRLHHI